jgi:hypothetical protein
VKTRISALSVLALIVALTPAATPLAAAPLGTGFIYQGQLKENGAPANGVFDFEFRLFDLEAGGVQQGGTVSKNDLLVENGLITVDLDFGNVFDGNRRWLEVRVRDGASAGAFTPLTPRQELTATPYALFALSSPGSVSGSGTTNTIPLWSGGTTLGNSQITQSGAGVQLPNNVQLAAGAQGNNVAFGSPNGETGMTIAGATGRADVRFDGTTLRLLAGPAGAPPANGIAINSTSVQMPNNVQLGVGTQGNQVQFGSPNSETGMSISGVSGRADLRFDGTLKLVNGPGGIPPATNGIAINTSGNVGMGTVSPNTRLTLSGGPDWTSAFWTASMNLQNASAIGWEANASGQRFGIGQTSGGLVFFRTYAAVGQTIPPANYDMVITDNGDVAFGGAIDIGYEIVRGNGTFNTAQALCPTGKRVLGGGCECGTDLIRNSQPSNDGTSWNCVCDGDDLSAWAICAKVK